ncbi:MAG: hypothetical protein KBD16_03735 [Candidatus Pacebacteria bacterium]|nr:hypothetical protein [Candidatus Paceibacterota bacterium]
MRPKKLSGVFFTIAFVAIAPTALSVVSAWSMLGPVMDTTPMISGLRLLATIISVVATAFGVLFRFAEGTHGLTNVHE